MPDAPVDVRKSVPPRAAVPDVWQAFRKEMDRAFDRFSTGFPSLRQIFDLEPAWRLEGSFGVAIPAIDVTEDEESYKIAAELPGMTDKDIDVTVSGDVLALKGEKRQEREEKERNRYLSERSYGAFQRSFRLPDGVDRDKITADFSKGVLTLILPKEAEAQKTKKKIDIKVV